MSTSRFEYNNMPIEPSKCDFVNFIGVVIFKQHQPDEQKKLFFDRECYEVCRNIYCFLEEIHGSYTELKKHTLDYELSKTSPPECRDEKLSVRYSERDLRVQSDAGWVTSCVGPIDIFLHVEPDDRSYKEALIHFEKQTSDFWIDLERYLLNKHKIADPEKANWLYALARKAKKDPKDVIDFYEELLGHIDSISITKIPQ